MNCSGLGKELCRIELGRACDDDGDDGDDDDDEVLAALGEGAAKRDPSQTST